MQKLTNPYLEFLKPVILYLDDLEQIVEILRQVSDTVRFSTGAYAINDLQQLADLKRETLNELHISIAEPHVSLSLRPNQISLYINKDDPTSRGLFEQIKKILIRRKRPFAWLLHNSFLVGVAPAIGIYPLFDGIAKSNWLYIAAGVATIGLGVLWAWYGFQDMFKRYSIIIPKHRIEAPSFLKRNSDAIVLSVISAIAGGIITLVIAKLTGAIP